MFDNKIATHSLKTLSFGTYTTKEVKSLSVKEVTNPQAFDALGHPVYGGPYDPALGPNDRDDVCATCGLGTVHCPGHMGHVALPLPVYNPVFFGTMLKILRGTCFYCCRLVIRPESAHLLECQLSLLDRGLISATYQLEEVHHELLTQGIAKGTQEMKQHLDEHVRDFIADAGYDENRSGAHVKHVVECRQNLVKEFISGKYFTGNVCLHCEMKTAKYLRSEHNTKVFFHTQGRQKAADIHKVKPAQPSIKHHSEVEGDLEMDQVDMDEEQEGNKENTAPTEVEVVKSGQMYLTPLEARSHLRKVFNADGKVLGKILGALNITTDDAEMCPTDMFFLEVLPVPPNRFRPVSVMGDQRFENAQTANLSLVVTDILAIKEILTSIREKDSPSKEGTAEPGKEEAPQTDLDKSKVTEKLQAIWLKLQGHVNCIIDSELDKLNSDKNPGIRQILEKKEGLFRKHMMGKRVNYAARSVISPDPYINTNEIGIPDVFAKKLTYPQPVTPWNFQQLKQAVINGPNIHPGAVLVENEDGSRTLLSAKNKTQREAVAKQLLTPSTTHGLCLGSKKVYRHLKNGDVLLLNRQPTLHRPSIQAHKARVLHGEKTLRLHYANCKAYNADFDGDEMNAHFPQNELARAEAYNIASTDFQYLVPKDGTPLAGLIQDHMVSGVMLTIRGRFFNRRDYQQLVYSALSDRNGPVIQLPPTLLKPQILWSGKQVFSTVLLNVIPTDKPALNLTGKTKISGKAWLKVKPRYPVSQIEGDDMSESQVVIRGGQLLVGVLDKGHYGPTPYGLVHSCYELYGGEVAGRLLTCLARLFTSFLQLRGFTLGVEDILVKSKADKHRSNCIRFSRGSGASVAASALGVKDFSDQEHLKDRLEEAHFNKDDGEMKDLDLSMKGHTDELQNEIVRHCMPLGLHKQFPDNNLQLMVQSGAKGSTVNCMQISCLLGQIELEGRRPPLMMSGASLPSFLPYDMTPRAGGFVDGRFLTGIRPQEYFFHCMAGREGLVDTAVKTSRSGYLQRCIIKHLEGLTVGYDLTVRDSDSSVIQFQYGEDGLDVTKTQYLKSSQFPFLVDNKGVTVRKSHLKQVQKHTDCEAAPALWKKIKKWKKKSKKRQSDLRRSPFLLFSQKNFASVAEEFPNNTITPSTGRSSASSHLVDMWKNTEVKAKHKLCKKCKKCPDPVASRLLPSNNLGAVTERLDDVIEKYLKEDPDKLFTSENHSCKISEDKFRSLVYMRSMRSLCEPGEAVGLLAAQSIGEPSTQMTLNTFHFAGRGEMNVTLGIPRLREILMVASTSIKTPMMDVPLKDSPQAREQGEKLRLTLNKVHLDQVLEDVQLCEKVSVKKRGGERCRLYCIRFQFLPKSVYESEYCLTPQRILGYMEKSFIVTLCDVVKKWLAELQKAKLMTSGTVRPAFGTSNRTGRPAANQEENDVSDDDLHDDDATATRNRERQQQELDGGEDDEKKEIGEQEEMQDSEEEDEVVDEAADEETQEMTYTLDDATPSGGKKHRRRSKQTMDDKRVQNVLLKSSMVQDYKYDPDEELWCEVTLQLSLSAPRVDMATLVEDAARKALVYQTPGIKRGMLNESRKLGEEGKLRLRTEGINIQEIYKYSDILDLSKLYTNDIHVMANTYGIEAAARVIVQEIRDVFAAYGITVDPHHLSLVSDYMTFEGKYKPFNRVGIESNASPLQKMSFETTMHFLRNATITGASDDLKSPSSRLVVGRLVKGGTGAFELRQPFM